MVWAEDPELLVSITWALERHRVFAALHRQFAQSDHHEENRMPAVFVPGGPYIPPNTQQIRLANSKSTDSDDLVATFDNFTGGLVVICGVDMVIQRDSAGGPYFAHCDIDGALFYWDSQSVGEGRGITFSWRGAQMLFPDETATFHLEVFPDGATKGIVAWGLVAKLPLYLPPP